MKTSAHHVVSPRVYLTIFALLLGLTAATVAVAYVDLGPFSPFIALSIAIFKATLVVLYFMHVRYGTRLTWVAAAAGFFWLHILLVILVDYLTRGWLSPADW